MILLNSDKFNEHLTKSVVLSILKLNEITLSLIS